jgi:hypothetical protein
MSKAKVNTLLSPVASDDVTTKADFLELQSFRAADKNISLQDLTQELKRSGSTDAIGDPEAATYIGDWGAETSQALSEDTFNELEDRHRSCGGETGQYPFDVGERQLSRRETAKDQVYTFLLLLSRFGIKAGPKGTHGERILEDLCRHAAEGYLGGRALGARAEHFGFPRRVLPKDFPKALQELANLVGDFTPNEAAPGSKDQKDAKLDIVAWRPFPDGRPGKIIAFGQCAAGRANLDSKISELQISSFYKSWLREQPSVDPVRMFFVPWRVNLADYRKACIEGGIVFDRCRISYFCGDIARELRHQCREWSGHVLRERLV